MNIIEDYKEISKFCHLSKNTKEWVWDNRERLRQSANIYEKEFMSYLKIKNIKFIHQALFYVCGKIYFLDFYIPSKKLAIEIDGDYHSSITQMEIAKILEIDVKELLNSTRTDVQFIKLQH